MGACVSGKQPRRLGKVTGSGEEKVHRSVFFSSRCQLGKLLLLPLKGPAAYWQLSTQEVDAVKVWLRKLKCCFCRFILIIPAERESFEHLPCVCGCKAQ